jgi:O-antigen ligase
LNAILFGLLAAAIVLIQCLIGGTRLVFSLPAYGLLAMAAILSLGALRRPAARADAACLAVTAIFFGYILTRAAWSPWDYLWWQDFFQVLGCLAVYGIVALHLDSARARLGIVAVLLVLAGFEFFIGLRQFRYADNWMPFGFLRADSGARASGMKISSIHFAGLLEITGAFALAAAFWSRWAAWARAAAGLAALLSYAGIVISGSRGGYISGLFSLAVFVMLSLAVYRRLRPARFAEALTWTALGTIVLVVGSILLMSQNEMLSSRMALIWKQDLKALDYAAATSAGAKAVQPAMDVRIYNWQAALDQFRLAPWLGTGAGTHLYYGRLFRRPQIQADPIHAHGDYLELLAEYGIVGALGMTAFLAVHLRQGIRRTKHILRTELGDLDAYQPRRSDHLALVLGALTAVAAYLAHSVVDFNLHIPGHALLFAFIFAILASPRGDARQVNEHAEMPVRLALPALGVWLAVAGLGKLPGEWWCERARVALRDRRFEDAIALAERALRHEQRNPDLYFHLGNAHRALGQLNGDAASLEKAVITYRRSLDIFPWNEHVLVRLGQALDALERFSEAAEAYTTAIAHDPNLGVLHAYYAQHLFLVGRDEQARASFAEARRLSAQHLHRIVDPEFTDAPADPSHRTTELK